jgi:hypothetical protein
MPPEGWPVETVMEMAANPTVGCPRAAAEAYFACRARTDPPWTMDGKSGPRAVGRTLTALRHDLTTWARVTWPNMQADGQRRTGGPYARSGTDPDEHRRAKAAREYPEPDLAPPMLKLSGGGTVETR